MASGRSDLLEGVLDLERLLHLFLHFLLEELAPHFLDHEVLPQLDLVRVLVLIGRSLCNLALSPHSVHPLLQGLLLVPDALLQRQNPLLSLLLLVVDVLHQVIQLVLGLQLVLLALPLLVQLIRHYGLL